MVEKNGLGSPFSPEEQDSNVSVTKIGGGENNETDEIQSDSSAAGSSDIQKKSFLLKLVEIVNSVYYYIFG